MTHYDILPKDIYYNQHTKLLYTLNNHILLHKNSQDLYLSRHAEFPQFTLPYTVPSLNSVWQHTNSAIYVPYDITNFWSDRQDKYPTMVSYRGSNNKVWSRPLSDWHRSMTLKE